MSLLISGDLRLRKSWQPMDTDAAAYITAVETADGQALEEKTKIAIDNFVLGCKQDGIWTAIKASCILAGARTRLGALTPLMGTAPTSFNFVDGDYNRKTGLGSPAGNSNKYLDSNRAPSSDPQDSAHIAVYVSSTTGGANHRYISSVNQATTIFSELYDLSGVVARLNTGGTPYIESIVPVQLLGTNRSSSSTQQIRLSGSTRSVSSTSTGRPANDYFLFARHIDGSAPDSFSRARLAFYSIGESLNLALLDARVTDLINAFAAAIP
ncbi:MAG: hypothetical protein MUP90_15380 [Gammaproteobacteria bacterium]|nr:hypothetical protein [Gammaproteobacteria bacterium]